MTLPKKTSPLDQEEQDLLDALEQADAKELPAVSPERQQMFRESAANFVSREGSMSISMLLVAAFGFSLTKTGSRL